MSFHLESMHELILEAFCTFLFEVFLPSRQFPSWHLLVQV